MLCYTAKGFHYTYIFFFSILFHYGLSQDIEYSFLCSEVGPCLFILYITVYICCPPTPHPILSPSPSLPWQPQVCSLCRDSLWSHMTASRGGPPTELGSQVTKHSGHCSEHPPPWHQLLRDGTGRWVSGVPHLCSGTRAGPDDKTQWDVKWKCHVYN